MEIVELEDDQVSLAQLAGPRSPGLHLSDILKQMMVEREPERFKRPEGNGPDPAMLMRAEVGFTFERVLERALADRSPNLQRPGEFTSDGIIMSPDAFDPDTWTLEEWKATWSSTKHDIRDRFWYWWYQIKAYCRALKTTKALVRVLYVNGDYGKSGVGLLPQIKTFRLQFTERELEENWIEIVNYARARGLLGKSTPSQRSRFQSKGQSKTKEAANVKVASATRDGTAVPIRRKSSKRTERASARILPFRPRVERDKK